MVTQIQKLITHCCSNGEISLGASSATAYLYCEKLTRD